MSAVIIDLPFRVGDTVLTGASRNGDKCTRPGTVVSRSKSPPWTYDVRRADCDIIGVAHEHLRRPVAPHDPALEALL